MHSCLKSYLPHADKEHADVCQIIKTMLQTHQEESVGLDIDTNIKYHQQSAIMFLFRAGKGNRFRGQNQFKVSHLASVS